MIMSLEHRTVNITQAAIFFSRLLAGVSDDLDAG